MGFGTASGSRYGANGKARGAARRAEHKGLGPVTIWSPEGRRRRDPRRGRSGTEGNEGEEEGSLDRAEEARGEGGTWGAVSRREPERDVRGAGASSGHGDRARGSTPTATERSRGGKSSRGGGVGSRKRARGRSGAFGGEEVEAAAVR